jgi:DNA helicase-2/ATP-dependent DNA helicase PcrA
MNNLRLVLGGPGCGKTTRLLNIVEQKMNEGVPAKEIAFVTFTKAAATEAKERAAALFSLDAATDLPWFRTIHSLAYARLSIQQDEIMQRADWRTFGTLVGEVLSGTWSAEDGAPSASNAGREIGDILLRTVDFAATTRVSLEAAWRALDEAVDWHRLVRFAEALRLYKQDADKIDFTDMLLQYAATGEPIPVRIAVIDEAQDLTAAQWAAVYRAFGNADEIYVGGDDDQAIYSWAGADVAHFLALSKTPEVLPISHRLPRTVHAFADTIARRISARYAKRFSSSDREGAVEWHQHLDAVDIAGTPGTWFLLARNNYMLTRIEAAMRALGVNYARRSGAAISPDDVSAMQNWERLQSGKLPDVSAREGRALRKLLGLDAFPMKELQRYTLDTLQIPAERREDPWYVALSEIPQERRDYYRTCLRRGEKMTKAPRIRIETIHGVKGAEADHVVLLPDLSSKTARSFRLDPDNEHRVFYVGATRALRTLHLVMPQSELYYPFGNG